MYILIALMDLVECQKEEQKDEDVEEEEEEYMMTTRRRNKMKVIIGSWEADIGMGSSSVCLLL